MKPQVVTICRGLPASGKTTWALEQVEKSQGHTKRVNKDELRAMIDGGKWTRANEKLILLLRDTMVSQILSNGYDVIVDDTNLHPKHIEQLGDIIHTVQIFTEPKRPIEIITKDFTNISPEVCIKRDLKRSNSVGSKVILDMYEKYIEKVVELPVYNPDLPDCIICDLDGTLANNDWRDPYDASEADKDGLIKSTYDILSNTYCSGDTTIILFSGRSDEFRESTERFLTNNKVPYNELHMRKEGDIRKDSIVKREMYERFIKNKLNVLFVLDDRDCIVKMYRKDLGLPCLQVNYGDF